MGSAAQFAAGSAPLPPLPDLQSAAGTGGQNASDPQQSAMAALVAGIAPIKSGVDAIVAACKQIVQSGAVPGAEQPCAQIVALATSLLPAAAQQAMQPGQGGAPPPQPSGGMQGIPGGAPPPTPGQ